MASKMFFGTISEMLKQYNLSNAFPYYITSGEPLSYYPEEAFGLDYYSLAVCLEGSGHILFNNSPEQITKNKIFVSAPGTTIQMKEISTDFTIKQLFYEKDFLLKNIADPFLVERMGFFSQNSFSILEGSEAINQKIINLMLGIEEKMYISGKFKDDYIRTSIFLILLEAGELLSFEQTHEITPKDLFYRFIKLVQENVPEHTHLSFYANQLNLSDKYLIEIVKEASGKTPGQIIDETLLKRAVVLLNSPQLNITDITYQLNFSSVSTFSRFFKKHSGYSPSLFQKKALYKP
jgi:AraC family 4-hydroxyphenylacetate 3-monooxygenase operon regulatory protein